MEKNDCRCGCGCAVPGGLSLGIQLYTVREEFKRDPAGTLRQVAALGFRGVEFAFGYGGLDPAELAAILRETGLACLGIYGKIEEITAPESDLWRYARALGAPFFTVGLTGMVSAEKWPAAIALVEAAAAAAADGGVTLLYHNHWQEFTRLDGEYALDVLLARTDPGRVRAELDTAWVKKGGADPVAYVRRYAGRLPLLHVKDITAAGEVTEIGRGTVDFPAVVAAAREAGTGWLVYEQDTCAAGAFESAAVSYRCLAGLVGA